MMDEIESINKVGMALSLIFAALELYRISPILKGVNKFSLLFYLPLFIAFVFFLLFSLIFAGINRRIEENEYKKAKRRELTIAILGIIFGIALINILLIILAILAFIAYWLFNQKMPS